MLLFEELDKLLSKLEQRDDDTIKLDFTMARKRLSYDRLIAQAQRIRGLDVKQ